MNIKSIIAGLVVAVVSSVSAYAADTSTSVGNFKFTPYVEAKGFTTWQGMDVANNQYGGGAAVGLDFSAVRFELEALHGVSAATGGNRVGGSINGNQLNFNGYVQPVTFAGFTPYVGGGFGYGWLSGTSTVVNPDSVLYNAGAGVLYAITPRVGLDLAYRYTRSFDRSVYDTGARQVNWEGSSAIAGIRLNF
jgi:opacity protein-like surface antigen